LAASIKIIDNLQLNDKPLISVHLQPSRNRLTMGI
jgi:hypothetical protein